MNYRILAALLLASGFTLGTTAASGARIDGAITMSGDFAPTGGTDLSDATGIDFLGNDFSVDDATGDFALFGINSGDTGAYQDFLFDPFVEVDPLWTIAGFEFTLGSIDVVFQNASFIRLEGFGLVSGNGFDSTAGSWNLTGNSAGALFTYSAGSVVSEPSVLLLLGLGLVGVAVARRRR